MVETGVLEVGSLHQYWDIMFFSTRNSPSIHMKVSINGGTRINHPFGGTPMTMETPKSVGTPAMPSLLWMLRLHGVATFQRKARCGLRSWKFREIGTQSCRRTHSHMCVVNVYIIHT